MNQLQIDLMAVIGGCEDIQFVKKRNDLLTIILNFKVFFF